MNKLLILIASLILTVTLASCSLPNDGDNPMERDDINYTLPTNPNFGTQVSAHDPSVFKDTDGTYYTFGSHFAVTKSTNLLQWQQLANDGGSNLLYSSPWKEVLSNAADYIPGGSSTWAPSVHYLGGKYYMYYSLSTFGSSVSFIGRVESDNVLGPYSNSLEIVKSDGQGGPNAIDPELFFDTEGRLWMVYGSFFGGIYIKEMYSDGENIGLPKEAGYGKLLWQGGNTGPEGPVIFYNPDTEYYYLMVSFGSLSSNYNMRVARSKNPDGPYVDPNGTMVENVHNSGQKLVGNYQFEGYQRGYAALGHNSVLVENGKYYAVYHTRYRQGTTGVTGFHNQQVNQILFNKNGWPVLAPNRYANETLQKIEVNEIAKTYDVLIHTGGSSESFAGSNRYQFKVDGTIVDSDHDIIGTWTLSSDYYVSIKIGLHTYEGVVIPQWNHDLNKPGLSITAYSRNGLSLWANEQS